jgi:murein DD-endopeptidase MepM/ murein hydrolase activator NlpD
MAMAQGWKRLPLIAVSVVAALALAAVSPQVVADPTESAVSTTSGTLGSSAGMGGSSTVTTLDEARQQLTALEDQQKELSAQTAAAQEKLTNAATNLATTQQQIVTQQATVDHLRDQLSQIALQQYQDRGLNTPAMLMTSTSSEDLLGYFSAMQQVSDTADTLFTSLQVSTGTLQELQRSEQSALDTITEQTAALAAAQAALTERIDEASQLLNQMTALAAVKAGAVGVNSVAMGVADPSQVVPGPSASLVSPLKSYTVTSPFSMRVHPISGAYAFHDGLDMGAACGTPVLAPGNGFVIDYYYAGGYGNRMVVDNGVIDGHHIVTSYNHLSGKVASAGDSVTQGQEIAKVGTTGASTGCHLHYMVWSDGQTMDPAPYIP